MALADRKTSFIRGNGDDADDHVSIGIDIDSDSDSDFQLERYLSIYQVAAHRLAT